MCDNFDASMRGVYVTNGLQRFCFHDSFDVLTTTLFTFHQIDFFLSHSLTADLLVFFFWLSFQRRNGHQPLITVILHNWKEKQTRKGECPTQRRAICQTVVRMYRIGRDTVSDQIGKCDGHLRIDESLNIVLLNFY